MDPREQNSIKFYNLSQEVAQTYPLLSLHLLIFSAEILTSVHRDLKANNDPRKQQVEGQVLNLLNQIQQLKAQNPLPKDQARQQLTQYILQGIYQTQQAFLSGTNPNDLTPWFHKFISYIEMMENLQNLDPQLAQQRIQIISTLGQIQQNQQQQQQQQQQLGQNPGFTQQQQTPGRTQQINNPMQSTVRQPNSNNINEIYETPQGKGPLQQIGLPPQGQLIQNQFNINNAQQQAPDNSLDQQLDENLPQEIKQKIKESNLTEMDIKAMEIILQQTQISPAIQEPVVAQPSQRQPTQFVPQQQQQTERIKSIYHPPGMDMFGQDGMINLQPPNISPLYSDINKEETKDQNENNYFFIKSNDITNNNNSNNSNNNNITPNNNNIVPNNNDIVPNNNNNNNILPNNNNFGTPGFDGVSIPSQIKKPSPQPPLIPTVVTQQPTTLPIPPSNQPPAPAHTQQLPTSFNPREKGKVKLMAIKNIEQIIQQARTGKNEELKAQLTETIRLLETVHI